jgi:hypothetical protein
VRKDNHMCDEGHATHVRETTARVRAAETTTHVNLYDAFIASRTTCVGRTIAVVRLYSRDISKVRL